MGRGNADGEIVDDAAWDAFLADTATPRFPDGLTVLDTYGQWRNPAGVVERERSKVLVVLAPPGEEPLSLIHEVSDDYKRRFGQDAVLQATSDACVAFR